MGEKNHRAIGTQQELKATEYLKSLGYEILEQNFYSRFGEIDIIAREDNYLVFVEVKYRSSLRSGAPEESIPFSKIRKICKTAVFYMTRHRISTDCPIRFDVVAMEGENIHLLRNAFSYVE